MDKLVFSCFLLGGLTPDPGPTDSCALNAYCATGLTNVGCNPPPIIGASACDGLNLQVIPLLEAEQNYILELMNQDRNSFAAGLYGNTPANRMFKLQWDANLATQAGHNARSCVVARDACRNTADYANVGQLISSYLGTIIALSSITTTDKINNIYYGNLSFTYYFSGDGPLSSYAASTNTENVANVLNDRSTKVGCALVQWNDASTATIYMVCNFSGNVIEGQPIFTTAAFAGVGCATKDMAYGSLCFA